jgi:uncharacterized protein with HEPN domain
LLSYAKSITRKPDRLLGCIKAIRRYTAAGKRPFLADRLTQSGTIRELQVLSESTQRLPSAWKVRHPDIDWRGIAEFRNVLVNGYLGLDLDQVWDIVQDELEPLKVAVDAMLADVDADEDSE